jgi:hypothetical protein
VISIAYVSGATKAMSEADIVEILVQSRANNTNSGLTGALLYSRGRFVQILEGPEEELLRTYRAITLDPRHHNLHELSRESIQARQFPQWTMGFRPLSEKAVKKLDGFDKIFGRTGTVDIKHADASAQLFLKWLGEYWFKGA